MDQTEFVKKLAVTSFKCSPACTRLVGNIQSQMLAGKERGVDSINVFYNGEDERKCIQHSFSSFTMKTIASAMQLGPDGQCHHQGFDTPVGYTIYMPPLTPLTKPDEKRC